MAPRPPPLWSPSDIELHLRPVCEVEAHPVAHEVHTLDARTDREGAFRFSFRGFGWGGPREWFLRGRLDGCGERTVRVILQEAPLPPDGDREGDVARDVEIRLPACAR